MVEIKDVELPEQMKRVMAREAESERERRAKKIHAQGELEAAETLASVAGEMERHPIVRQLRTLSTLSEIAAERNSTIIFPLPFELLRALEHLAGPATPADPAPATPADPGSPADEPPAAPVRGVQLRGEAGARRRGGCSVAVEHRVLDDGASRARAYSSGRPSRLGKAASLVRSASSNSAGDARR